MKMMINIGLAQIIILGGLKKILIPGLMVLVGVITT